MFTIHAMVGKRQNQINMPRLYAYGRVTGATMLRKFFDESILCHGAFFFGNVAIAKSLEDVLWNLTIGVNNTAE